LPRRNPQDDGAAALGIEHALAHGGVWAVRWAAVPGAGTRPTAALAAPVAKTASSANITTVAASARRPILPAGNPRSHGWRRVMSSPRRPKRWCVGAAGVGPLAPV